MSQLALRPRDDVGLSVSPFREMGAYEALWVRPKASFKTLAEQFRRQPDAMPSDFVAADEAERMARWVTSHLHERGVTRFGVRVYRAGEYPAKLRDAQHPIELLYFRGIWNLVEAPSVAVVGTRVPTEDGVRRARRLVKDLAKAQYTIVSGLAAGIDTVAHQTALEVGARTIAVLGTPLSVAYPAANRELQERIGKEHLVISQVPVKRHSVQGSHQNRRFFPARNVTMAALTDATIIVEAGETSGTLVQARAALEQGRKLFILESAFERNDLTWPRKMQERGAIRLASSEQLIDAMKSRD